MKKFTDTFVYKILLLLIGGYMLYTTIEPLMSTPVKAFKCYLNDDTTARFFTFTDSSLNYLDSLKDAGINHFMFLSHESDKANYHSKYLEYNQNSPGLNDIFKVLEEKGFDYSIIFQFFYSPTISESQKQVDQFGDNSSTGWQRLACPNDSIFVNSRLFLLKEVLNIFKPEMIHIDFLRYQYFWEEQGTEPLDDTTRTFCFCERCRNSFSKFAGIPLRNYIDMHEYAYGKGRTNYIEWRTETLVKVLARIKDVLNKTSPKTELSVNVVPILPGNDKQLQFFTGQDIEKITLYTENISPMLYTKILKIGSEYFTKYLKEIKKLKNIETIPAIEINDFVTSEMVYLQKEYSGNYSLFHFGKFLKLKPEKREEILSFILP